MLTGDAWAADDLVQDTLERACSKWLLWRSGSDLRAWLFTLMHNLYLNQRRGSPPLAAVDIVAPVTRPQPPAGADGTRPTAPGRPRTGLAPPQMSPSRNTSTDDDALWQTQRDQLKALHQDLLRAPVPEALQTAALRLADRQAQQVQWWRWGGMAASVLLAFALGWAGRAQWPGGPGEVATQAQQLPTQRFALQAAMAHAVFQPEVRHPVEVGAAQQEHLVQWLSKRLGRPLHVPVLAPQGYELVGGRLLPGDTGARAQFMYQDSAGQRITLYLGALPSAASETGFQFADDGPVPGFYWTDAGFGYALSGQLSRAQLLELATAVYPQLQP